MLTILFDKSIRSHRELLKELKLWAAGISRIPPDPDYAANPAACDLGQWLASGQAAAVIDTATLQQINALHQELHTLIDALLRHDPNATSREQLLTDIARLEEVTRRLIRQLTLTRFALFNP